MHLGSSSFPGVGQPSTALCSWLCGTTELRGSDGVGSLWQRVGAERSTAAQISSVCFSGRFNLSSEVDLRKYAVRVGDSSWLRGWRGVSRGAENVLRTEESTLEKQVSFGAENSYSPRCSAFWCLGDNWGAHFPSVAPSPCVSLSPPLLPLSFSGAGPCEVAPRPSLLSCWHHCATLGCCLVNINFKY